MYKIVPWSDTLDLTDFYETARQRNFTNNSTEKMLVDSFRNEHRWQVWLLTYNDNYVGSFASHSFDLMGENCYRICARTCVFSDMIPTPSLRTRNQIVTHQHITSQFFIPTCLEWVGNNRSFITTNENEAGTQRLVHNIFAPSMEKTGQMKRIDDVYYRGTNQTVWELFPDKFYEELNKYPRWTS